MLQTEFHSLVGTIARRARIEADYTQDALCSRSGVTRGQLYALENGRRFTPLTLARIELALGVSVWPIRPSEPIPLSDAVLHQIMRQHFEALPRVLTARDIVLAATQLTGLEPSDLRSPWRLREYEVVRRACCHVAAANRWVTMADIARELNRSLSSVYHLATTAARADLDAPEVELAHDIELELEDLL
ncbi:MAG TPA: helix-turn-helix transcriptional regulator [Acidobacteriota bacterium]|nr:helix-turn-helix transcriptional regulator [Acidobacteriota bacterium]